MTGDVVGYGAAGRADARSSPGPGRHGHPMHDDDLIDDTVALKGWPVRLLRPRSPEALLDDHAFEDDEFMPYWADLWPSGVALARRVHGRRLAGRRVLELGCGLGLPSLAAARAGARVLATDWSQPALDLLARNAELNGVPVETERVDWRAPQTLTARAPFGLVLAADVLYERRNVALLLDLLPLLGAEVWLADPRRSFTEAFLAQAPRHWTVDTVPFDGVLIHVLRRLSA